MEQEILHMEKALIQRLFFFFKLKQMLSENEVILT